jgi:hypothetical protein
LGKGREEPRVGETKPLSHTKPNHQVEIFDVRYTGNDQRREAIEDQFQKRFCTFGVLLYRATRPATTPSDSPTGKATTSQSLRNKRPVSSISARHVNALHAFLFGITSTRKRQPVVLQPVMSSSSCDMLRTVFVVSLASRSPLFHLNFIDPEIHPEYDASRQSSVDLSEGASSIPPLLPSDLSSSKLFDSASPILPSDVSGSRLASWSNIFHS